MQFIKQIWVTATVPEEECVKLHLGQTAGVRFDALPRPHLYRKDHPNQPLADVQSRQFMVRVIIGNTDSLLKPGMFAHVDFETDRFTNALVVPREAIMRGKDGAYVMAVDKDHRAKRVPIVSGMDDARFVSVIGRSDPRRAGSHYVGKSRQRTIRK